MPGGTGRGEPPRPPSGTGIGSRGVEGGVGCVGPSGRVGPEPGPPREVSASIRSGITRVREVSRPITLPESLEVSLAVSLILAWYSP